MHDSIGSTATSEAFNVPLEGLGVDGDDEFYVDEDGRIQLADDIEDRTCNDKPEIGNCKLRVQFGRKHTHNEQLCVASGGVILGRVTFYGSEAPNGVRVSVHCI